MFTKARGYSSLGSSGSQEEIPTDSSEFDHEKADINGGTYQRIHGASFHQTWPWISLTINILLVLVVGYQHLQLRPLYSSPYPPFPRLLYSPAQDAISYTLRTFTDNDVPPSQQEPNPYLGPPTAEIDAAWNELYNIGGINQISNSEAAKLSESTAEVLDEDGFSFMGLDVFHQLHCLNWVRHGLRPERYWEGMEGWSAERRLAWDVHNDHCIDSLRQSLMCSADISPIIWRWTDEGALKQNMNNTHVCRDFSRVEEWARQHMLNREINSRLEEHGKGE